MIRRLAVTVVAALAFASGLSAQGAMGMPPSTRAVQFGLGGGAIIPRTNARAQDVLAGATGQAYLLVRLAPGFPAIRLGADFARMSFGDPRTSVSQSTLGSTRTQLGGIASLRFDLLPGPVRPYVLAGVGAFNIRDALQSGATSAGTLSVTQVGIDGGAGVTIRLGRISGFVETRIQNVYTKQQGVIDTKSIQAFPVTFGVIF